MRKVTLKSALHHTSKAVSWALMVKSMVGFSVAVLALFGVTVHFAGIDPPVAAEGAAAGIGALLGAVLALRA